MRALIQRVKNASVTVEEEIVGQISSGLLVFLGVMKTDGKEDINWICNKIKHLRIFPDETGKMSRSVIDQGGSILLVSQFTLCADMKKGTRPSFSSAMEPKEAQKVCQQVARSLSEEVSVEEGQFGAMMDVSLVNDGPVTIWIDSVRSVINPS